MRTDRKKVFLYGGIGAALLAGLIIWIGSGKPFGGADLSGDTDQSMSFELQNPVCSIQAEQGTKADELDLPSVLRAVIPLEEVHMENFVQAEPGVNFASGDYDYYSYGYVAPRDEEELYRENKPVVYTITYAGDEKDPEGSMKKGYRVYGSLNGRENSWFACDEAGVITGEVAEVPVVWDTDTYDKDTLGVYQIAGEIAGDMAEECGRPTARVEVKDKSEMESFSVETAHVHAGPSTETESLTGKGNKAEEQSGVEATAAEDRTEDVSEGGGAEETGDVPESGGPEDVSGNDRAEEKEDVSGNDTGTEEEDVSGNDVSGNDIYLDDTIEYFEEKTPVVKRKVGRGTETDKIGLPTSLKAVFFREEEEEVSEFVQMEPDPEEAERAGYIAPENEAQLRREGARVVYTCSGSPSEVLAREILRSLAEEKYGELEEPEKAYRLYGSLNGEEAGWYVCDENGTVTGRIRSVAVTWDLSAYDAETEGKYLVPAAPAGEYGMKGEAPCAEIEVAEPVCTCSAEEYNRPWEHERFCACFEPVQCMCREDEREDHDETNRDCPLWNHDIMELYRPNGVTLTWVMLEDIVFFLENGFTIPEEPRILYGIADMSLNGGGANDVAQDNYMDSYTAVDSAKGEWVNYANTVWKNKGKNKFAWATEKDTGYAGGWDGSVAYANGDNNNLTPEKNRYIFPRKDSSGAYIIYSPQQLRYALLRLGENTTAAMTITIKLAKDIDLNGSNYNWEPIIRKNVNCTLILDGQGHTIYNLGVYTGNMLVDNTYVEIYQNGNYVKYPGKIGQYCVFIECNGNGSSFKNLTFSNAKLVGWTGLAGVNTKNSFTTSIFGMSGHESFDCITIKDSLMFGGDWVAPLTYNGGARRNLTNKGHIKNCYVDNCYVYGRGHIGGMTAMILHDVSYSYVKDTLVVGLSSDIGGFNSCSGDADYYNCFVSNGEIYAGCGGGFEGVASSGRGKYENCFASGVVRAGGGAAAGGFVGIACSMNDTAPTYTRCYSTTHVLALYDTCTALGGFAGATSPHNTTHTKRLPIKFDSCYAAGEVGNYTIDLSINNRTSNDRGWGGFVGEERVANASGAIVGNATIDQYKYCYYDKQTTGMREWISGTKKSLIENGKQADVSVFSNNGIRGVMTSGTSTSKGGAGLADGSEYPVTGDSKGFVGFSAGSSWTRGYSYDQYPQIFSLYYATGYKDNWKGPDGQPSDVIAQTVSNASKASVQTVKLNTWENGSNWSSYGTRSDASYGAVSSTAYKGGLYTYDTVRDIVSPGTARRGYSGTWNEMITGGAPAQETGWGNQKVTVGSVEISGTALTPIHPGVDWFEYRTSGSVNSQTGRRPIRLNCLMTMDAGADTTVTSGQYYNHRRNSRNTSDNSGQDTDLSASPVFRMATAMNDKLVLGMDNSKYWSEYILGRYGHATRKYYNVSPKDKGYSSTAADLTTNFPTGKDSRIYTEIWRAKKDSSGNWVEDVKVCVTGVTDNNSRREQQRWNGSLPMYTDLSTGRTYIVRYYWLLKDGRYITDSRTVTVNPDTYYLTMQVRNSADSTLNSSALYVKASGGVDPVFSTTTGSQSTYSNCPYTGNAVAAWRETDNYRVNGIKLEMLNKAGAVIGTNEVRNTEVKEGTQITVSYPKEYFSKSSYEYSYQTTVTVTYTVRRQSDGRYYLVFNKMKNEPSDEVSTAKANKDLSGISGGTTNTYINDMQNDVRLTLYVEPTNTLTVKKVMDENAKKYSYKDQRFPITIILSTGPNGTGTGYTGTGIYTLDGWNGQVSFKNGKAMVSLKDQEKAVIKNIPKEYGYYSVIEGEVPFYNTSYQIVDSASGTSDATSVSRSFGAGAGTPGTVEVTVKNSLQLADYFRITKTVVPLETDSTVDEDQEYQIDLLISKSPDFSDSTFSGEFSSTKLKNGSAVGGSGFVSFKQGKTTITLKNGEGIEIRGLPAGYIDYNTGAGNYYFKVEEQADSAWGFDTVYSYRAGTGYLSTYSGAEGQLKYQQKVEASVRNTEQPIPYYELPNAGGMGTYGYTAGGAAVMMTALLLFIKYLRAQKAQRME